MNPHGTPIWYELQTADPDAAKRFYDDVAGWTVEPRPAGPMDYRMIDTGAGGLVGGVARFTPGVTPAGMTPGWTVYLGVDDVDETAATVAQAGGRVLLAPFDLPGVGRMAFVAEPGGTTFYVMRGASNASSTAWDRHGLGKCGWNELATPDQQAADDFFARVFGWRYPDRMPMGAMGDYVFVEAGGEGIGATMTAGAQRPPGWRFHFRVPDVESAAARVTAAGGIVQAGPMDVPGGERIVIASDPEGLPFGLVAGGAAA